MFDAGDLSTEQFVELSQIRQHGHLIWHNVLRHLQARANLKKKKYNFN